MTDRDHFPNLIRQLPNFNGHFHAFELEAGNSKVLFASYQKNQLIPPHTHDSENVGVVTMGELILQKDGKEGRYAVGEWYHLDPGQVHAARFEQNTAIIEFWFNSSSKKKDTSFVPGGPFKF